MMKTSFVLPYFMLILLSVALDCNHIKYANGPSKYYADECECISNYLWADY